ncbi:MAG: efflux RND transporter periplasmic adaptor subunit [Thermoanaerobaculia bacterium]|nr:efflux RND transporter periplasmic adaptor subunit [Thermoanaerobaculia bacterium]
MKKVLMVVGVLAVLGTIVTASLLKGRDGGEGKKVYAEEAVRRDISRIVKASGTVDPRTKVNISPHLVARIEALYVEEGQQVEAGEPFLTLEKEAFVAAEQRAAAQVEIARTQLRQGRVDLADAELKLKRARRLAAEQIVSDEQLEAAQLQYESARLRVEQAEEALRQARADLDKARDDLEKTTIYAPIDGRVIELNAEEGEVVVTGTMNNPASVVATVADLSEILVEVDVDETEVVAVEVGQEAVVTVDAIPDHEYQGRLVEIGSSGFQKPTQPDVTYFKAKVLLENPDRRLRPGMSARAEIEVATHEDTVVVPIQAVVYRAPVDSEGDAEEIRVVLVVEDGRAVQRPVEVGITDTTHAELLEGVEAGARVVTGPQRTLKDLSHDDEVWVEEENEDGEGDDDGQAD